MNAPGERILQVGGGRFDPLSGELAIDGHTTRLRPRTAALLAHLVRHADRIVGKDELLSAVWPDVIVTEASLTQCVKEIRHALGGAGRELIRTVPRQGYAFVGQAPDGAPAPPRRRPGVAVVAFAAIVLAVLTGFGLWSRPHEPRDAAAMSIVVMPFSNLTGDAARDNDVDDLTERVIQQVSRWPRAVVVAPSTAFTFKGKLVDVRRVGAELGVRYVVEGALRRRGAESVLSARLADTSNAAQLWSEDFVIDAERLTTLHDEIAARIGYGFGLRLVRAEGDRSRRAEDPAAADLVAQARALMRRSTYDDEALARARALLEEAVRRDDGMADAWALLAKTYIAGNVRFSPTQAQDLERAEQAASRALALAPDNVEALAGRAWTLYNRKRMPQALAVFEHALEIAPNDAWMLAGRAAALVMLGRADEALQPLDKAMRLSPRDPDLFVWQLVRGAAELHLGHDAAAVGWLGRAVEGRPRSPFPRLFHAAALANAGRLDEARAEMERFKQIQPGFTLGAFIAREPSDAPALRPQRERLYEGLRRAGMPE